MSRRVLLLVAALGIVPLLLAALHAQVKPEEKPASAERFAGAPDAKPASAAPVKAEKEVPKKERQRPAAVTGPLRVGEEAILKALEQPASVDFEETPLQEVVTFLREKHRIATLLDKKALDEAGLKCDTPVTLQVADIRLRSALELMLRDLGLTWTVNSDVLLVTTPEYAEQQLITKTYPVSDLIVPRAAHPYRSQYLPTVGLSNADSLFSPMGIGDGLGLTMSCGNGSRPPPVAELLEDMDSLMDLIKTTVRPTGWDTVGGPGSCEYSGNLIVISQTLEVHREVELLLADLRAKRQAEPFLVVDVQWLWLDTQQYKQLRGEARPQAVGRIATALDEKVLETVAGKAPGFRGCIACGNGQIAHLASGDRRLVLTSAVPVVGSGIGYQPVTAVPNLGVVLELRPSMAPGANTVALDVQSTVTRWTRPEPPAHIGGAWPPTSVTEGQTKDGGYQETTQQPAGSASAPVDRVNMPTQQLATTARVPLGKPVVLGAMTFCPTGATGLAKPSDDSKQLVLIATTSLADPEAEPAGKP